MDYRLQANKKTLEGSDHIGGGLFSSFGREFDLAEQDDELFLTLARKNRGILELLLNEKRDALGLRAISAMNFLHLHSSRGLRSL